MSDQHKMSYFSDIDLATLHRTRLNERIQYKLSWFNGRNKYYIPPTGNQKYHRDNATNPIKTNNDHRLSTYEKKTGQSIANGLSKPKSSHLVRNNNNSNNQMQTTNVLRKNANQMKIQMPNGNPIRNHCDNAIEGKMNDHSDNITILTKTSRINGNCENQTVTNNKMKKMDEKQPPTSNTNVFSSSFPLSLDDRNSSKSCANQNSRREKYLLADTINRKSHDSISNHTSDISFPCNSDAATIENAAIEDDLKLPHRKRSGTWP